MLEICLLINVIIPIVYVIIYRNTKNKSVSFQTRIVRCEYGKFKRLLRTAKS